MKLILLFVFLWAAGLTAATQTPPIKPQTPDIEIPAPIILPSLPEGAAGAKPPLSQQPLTVEEAVAIALQRQPAIAAARAEALAAKGRTQQTQSALVPQLGLNASLTEQDQVRGTGGGGLFNRFNAGISLEQLLFDFERTRSEVRRQRALEQATIQVLTKTEHETALFVRQAFYSHVESTRLIAVAEGNLANRQRQLGLVEARVDEGLGSPADFVRAKTNVAEAVIALETARSTALNSGILLAELMGIDPRTPLQLSAGPEPEDDSLGLDVNAMIETALQERPEIREVRSRLTAARMGVSIARLSGAPRIEVVAGINARGNQDLLQNQTASVGLTLSWTILDGGLARGREQEAKAQREALQATLQDTMQQVISEVSRAYVNLLSAEQRVRTATAQLENARELLRISEGRYRGEIGQFIEITDAQASLFTAEQNLVRARSDVSRAKAQLQRATGRL